MKLVIPKKIDVSYGIGFRPIEYTVERDPKLSKTLLGQTVYGKYLIRLTTKRLSRYEKEQAFWHEVTHAILNEMPEWKHVNCEAFVEPFSRRLHTAITSVEFKR